MPKNMPKKRKIELNRPPEDPKYPKEKLSSTDKKTKEPNNPALQSIYSSEEGEEIDMTTLERKPRRTAFKAVIISLGVLIILTGISGASFFIFNQDRQKSRGESSAALTVSTDTEIASGENITLTITYVNNDEASLVNTALQLQYPSGFTFTSAEPEPTTDNNTWQLDTISSGSAGQIKIKGQLIGEVPSTKTFTPVLTYKLSNFNYQFEKRTSQEIKITESLLTVNIEGPLKATDLQSVEYEIQYANKANFPLDNLVIFASYPSGFTFKSSEPKAGAENQVWKIESLASQSEGKIIVKGTMSGSVDESKELKARLGLIDRNDDFNFQAEDSALTLIVNPEMSLGLAINDQQASSVVNTGESLRYHLTYENVSDLELSDVELELRLSQGANNPPIEDIVEWESLDAQYAGAREDNVIRWNKESRPELASVKPHQKGELIFDIKVRDTIELKLESRRNVQISNVFTIPSFNLEGLELKTIKTPTQEQVVKINSPVKVNAEGRYFSVEFEPIGSGPLPPEAGGTTTYRVYWYVSNTLNDVSEVEVKTTLPKGVFWVGLSKTTAGDALAFDAATRQVTWRVQKIPAHTGTLLANLEAYFMISITPGVEDVGKLVALTEETKISGKDDFTENPLSDNDNLITTDLENDVGAKGRGVVVEATVEEEAVLPEEVQ